MAFLRKNIPSILLAFLFLIGIIVISYKLWIGLVAILLCLFVFYVKNGKCRFLTSIFGGFLVSFFIFQQINMLINQYDISNEWRILLNRSLLIIIIVGLYIIHMFTNKTISFYNQKPRWNNRVHLPFHSISIFHFWLIGLVINIAFFIPFVLLQDKSELKTLLLFCILFSVINATFEEVIWRGILFSSIQRDVSFLYAMIVTSIGFGLLHLSIGIPFVVSLFFSFAGVIYAMIVLKTNSIYPAILLHFIINIGMVLSGWIL